jgi:hypothetical protein
VSRQVASGGQHRNTNETDNQTGSFGSGRSLAKDPRPKRRPKRNGGSRTCGDTRADTQVFGNRYETNSTNHHQRTERG